MTADFLATISGAALSLVFAYIPGAAGWFASLDGTRKRLVMLALLALTSLAIYALACLPQLVGKPFTAPSGTGSGWWSGFLSGLSSPDQPIFPACTTQGAAGLLRAFFLALVANQSVYQLAPRNGRLNAAANGSSPAAPLTPPPGHLPQATNQQDGHGQP